ncbi:MAG TPA: hypothetical protein VND65_01045 [Candidatus Binatia bacterium]|nr:hypothetical protein [Candidatus Binatia bacterium]
MQRKPRLARIYSRSRGSAPRRRRLSIALVGLLLPVSLAFAREKSKVSYGEGLIINIPYPANEVEIVVQDVTDNGIIRGTKEYNKDEFVSGAKAEDTPHVFPAWNSQGKAFYKMRDQALDPRNFQDSSDVGVLEVRYIVAPQGDGNTVLRIDALFQETFRHIVHKSNGSVESAEYKDIQEHLEAIEVMKKQTIEGERERQQRLARKQNPASVPIQSSSREASPRETNQPSPIVEVPAQPSQAQQAPQSAPAPAETPLRVEVAQSGPQPDPPPVTVASLPSSSSGGPAWQAAPGQSLEDHVKDLRRQVERLVKSPGAPLKSAPFHTASTLKTLDPGTEVLILISTPYWFGVETHEGQHGWMMRNDLEQQP